jgi:hypothetical protein
VIRAALGARREAPDRFSVPSEATIRRTLARLDGDALTACVGAWLAGREGPDQRRRSKPASRHRTYGANPLSIQVRKRWTLSAGHGP